MSVYESFDEQKQFACRVIADHARTTAFAIADGILPGNEGRNYVLRKIMRRAIYHGREHLGFKNLFFHKVCDFVVAQMREAFPELEAQRDFIGKMVRLEEERFGMTLTIGLQKLNELFSKITEEQKAQILFATNPQTRNYPQMLDFFKSDAMQERMQGVENTDKIVPFLEFLNQDSEAQKNALGYAENAAKTFFSDLAKLYDTFGTPKDLTRVSLAQRNIEISEEQFDHRFDAALQELQQQSGIGKTQQKEKINPIYAGLAETTDSSDFRGYEVTTVENAKVVALIKDDQRVEVLSEGDEGLVVLNETPFYAESGGQVGDVGIIYSAMQNPPANAGGTDFKVVVRDCFAPMGGIILHKSKVERGEIRVGDAVSAVVDAEKRDATRRNHTATHLVHAALREVLGTHVKQAGSVVAPNYLRFDFTHYQPLSDSEIEEIERLVNRYILLNEPVNTDIMAVEDAMRSGAMALFGEKYGANVRVLSVGGGEFSRELCGGTHVRATGDIGSFKITADEAIASGVRRIRAITGFDAFERFREDERLIEQSLGVLKTQRDQLPNAIERLQEELKRTRREIEDLKLKIATGAVGGGTNGDEAKEISGVKVLAKMVEGLDANGVRQLSDTLLARLKSGVVVIGRKDDGKVSLIVRSSDDVKTKVPAGLVIKELAPIVGGRGGGKPDMAEGGGSQPEKLDEALQASYGVIEKLLQG